MITAIIIIWELLKLYKDDQWISITEFPDWWFIDDDDEDSEDEPTILNR